MIELERSVTVHKKLGEVVDYLADFSHTEEWDAGTKSCDRIDDGPIRVGAKWRNVSEFRGKQTELEYTLTRHESQRLVFAGKNKTVSTVDDMTFESSGDDRTKITYAARFTFHGLAALAQPFVKSSLNKLADDTIAKLRGVLDGG